MSDFGEADVKLIDGASMVHVLGSDSNIKTFVRDYAPELEKDAAWRNFLGNIELRPYLTQSYFLYHPYYI